MNIRILQLLEGAQKATGLTVIIDVFRAFSVEASLMACGVEKIIPVADIDLAYAYKAEDPSVVLVGERGGRICEGFDYGNSPSQLEGADLKGKTVVHTTSAGTQGLFGAKNAAEILGVSLLNAKATAKYIAASGYTDVSLVCMGLAGIENTEEDLLCAEYIKALLENKPYPLEEKIKDLQFTSGAKFFDPAQQEIFPEKDFHICTQVNRYDFVLKLVNPHQSIPYIAKG
ncbi:MAG: 2-phosphosulfolactate phosphatase [Oscillospiraceae bacterium]|nr:2-phosphosulfolactate phosphatase [Oscillospiraceae bacterium]